MIVLVFFVFLQKVLFDLISAHVLNFCEFGIYDMFSVLIEVRLIKIQWPKLIRSLENIFDLSIIYLIPHHNSIEMLDQNIFNMQSIPFFMVAIVF